MDQTTSASNWGQISVTEIDLKRVRETAEGHYRSGEFGCSEAVVKTIRDEFGLKLPDEVIAMASGFPAGMGRAGCVCGAVAGGVMALGMIFGRTQGGDPRIKHIMALSRELHDGFQERHRALCCRILIRGFQFGSPEHKNQCISLAGEVAEETARLIARELSMAGV